MVLVSAPLNRNSWQLIDQLGDSKMLYLKLNAALHCLLGALYVDERCEEEFLADIKSILRKRTLAQIRVSHGGTSESHRRLQF